MARRRVREDALALDDARRDAERCRRCDLWRNATQVVFGEGPASARVVLVGEQPGDIEDETGRPFVGPAGTLLRRVLGEVGLDEGDVYLTNAVKHFKWRPKGKRRIHDTPNRAEIRACDVWLRLELARIRPEVLVLLGATAAQAVLGRSARVNALRGRMLDVAELDARVVITLHPSAVLRAGERRAERRAELVADLGLVPAALREVSRPHRKGKPHSQGVDDRGGTVDSDRIEGKGKQAEGELQEKWGELKDKARDVKDDVEDAFDRDDDDVEVEEHDRV